ncbi:Gfo/Idh/MocA family oxidoreductase [Paracoccus sp. MC1854]|uniref:Gfo/Idh/MocA family protein n=1 Tax=Paracoccus sp. MC1854 TaxID=2760306 RepID=UPI0015FF50A7|nr:Gfo/Idh/MocA family oxidoreductase [Paracoccus sp. MC1854]MBB1489966.1 Gfo/Idh/MocA family oxidoreductase [Paracoccus sp. MC1854]
MRPRLGFLGTGWIGRHRMAALAEAGLAEIVAVAETDDTSAAEALALAPGARRVEGLNALLGSDIDAVVIATPSAAHAEQSIAALQAGKAVFCQKPLGRTGPEVSKVVEAARRVDRLLGVDLSYRQTAAMGAIRPLLDAGSLGHVFGVDVTFHNGWGPDKPWFYDPKLSGGGCVVDLGVHLIDLALWSLGWPEVQGVESRLYAKGAPLADPAAQVEDYAVATLDLAGRTVVRLACSWGLQAGREALIAAEFYGTEGGASLRNVNGSFYDLRAERHHHIRAESLAEPPDDWGGRAAVDWLTRLAQGARFDDEARHLVTVARVIDRIYGR